MKVLLVRAGALGDVLLLRRTVAALRRAGHSATLLAPRPSGAALIGPGPSEVQRLCAWDRAEVASLLSEDGPPAGPLRDELASHDAALAFTRAPALLRHLRGLIPRVVARDPIPAPGAHASRWYARCLDDLGIGAEEDPPPLAATPEERNEARPFLERVGRGFLAVHPGSGSPAKSWPADRFASLLERLGSSRPWLLVEGPADAAAVEGLASHPRAVLARGLPPRALGAVLSEASVYVGNDSGVSHLAAAYGAPSVVVFGPTDPAVWSPVGPRVTVVRSPDGTTEGVDVEAVTAAVTSSRR